MDFVLAFSRLVDYTLFALAAVIVAYAIRHIIYGITATRRRSHIYHPHYGAFLPIVSILVPARNEEKSLPLLLSRLAQLTYPKDRYEIIVVNDGSTDRTQEIAEQYARRFPNFRVVRTPGLGKPAALNRALPLLRSEVVIVFDADYAPPADIVERLVAPLADPQVALTQARIEVANRDGSWVARLVALERHCSYAVDMHARAALNLVPQYGGTAGAIRRSFLEAVGGFPEHALAEDTWLTYEALTRGFRVVYLSDTVCYETAPTTIRQYWRQRKRWAIGHTDCLFRFLPRVLASRYLNPAQKFDAIMLLLVYLVPALIAYHTLLVIIGYLLARPTLLTLEQAALLSLTYGAAGIFAPLFEISISLRDHPPHEHYLLLPLLGLFAVNIGICAVAFLHLLYHKITRKPLRWTPTGHPIPPAIVSQHKPSSCSEKKPS